jgi:hypothetical protein
VPVPTEIRGHIDASALSGFGFLIDRGLGYFRQGLVCGFFFVKCLLKKGSRISVAKLFGSSAQSAITRNFVVLDSLGRSEEAGIERR